MSGTNEEIYKRAREMARTLDKHSVSSAAKLVLMDLGFPVHLDGFSYLRLTIPLAFQTPSQIVVSELFDKIGPTYVPSVERKTIISAVEIAIKSAWKSRDTEIWRMYFPRYMMLRRKAPSILEVVTMLVYFLELWQDCYEKEAL